jgi:hypothetical protein
MDLEGENGEFRADHRAEFAMHTSLFHSRDNFRIVIAFGVKLRGGSKNLTGTKLDADFTFLTTFRDDINLSLRYDDRICIHRYSCEDSHTLLTLCRCCEKGWC